MKKIFATILVLTLLFTGCNNEEKQTKEYGDYKVISLSPSITDTIIGIGMEDTLVAVDTYSIFDETKDLVMLDALNINAEEILALKPTHILVSDYNYTGDSMANYKIFEDEGIKVIPISGAYSIDDIYKGISEVGKALDNVEASDQLIKDTKAKVEEIANKYKDYETKTVYMEIAPSPQIYTVANGSFSNEMIEIVGGKNVFDDVDDDYFAPSVEDIIQKNPEVIITNVSYIDNPVDEIMKREGWNQITAVKNNNVYQVDTDSTSRPSHNFVKGLEELAEAIHNEN